MNDLGRKRPNISVFICDMLRVCSNIKMAVMELKVSRGNGYKVLKANGLTLVDVIKKHAIKNNRLFHNGGLND